MKTLTVCLCFLLIATSCFPQQSKRRPPDAGSDSAGAVEPVAEKCIDIRLFPEKGKLHYEYLTGQNARGNLRWELGELKLTKGENCRVNVFVDEAVRLTDLKIVPRLAIDAGFLNIHVYALWSHTGAYVLSKKNLMAEITFAPGAYDSEEIVYGRVQRLSKGKSPLPKTATALLTEPGT